MCKLIAVDPGDRWTGVAFFTHRPDGEWFCQDAQEFDAMAFADALAETLLDDEVDILVYERFRLYGDKAAEQTGSEFETSQLIGIVKYLVRIHNFHAERHRLAEEEGKMLDCELPGRWHSNPHDRPWPVTIHGQMADIKKPTAGILRHKGIKSVARGLSRTQYEGRDHVVDAELHGWHYILNNKIEVRHD